MNLTSSCIQSAIAVVTLEMLCFLMGDKDLQVVKVALAVVAPRTVKKLLEGGTTSLFAHCTVDGDRAQMKRGEGNVELWRRGG